MTYYVINAADFESENNPDGLTRSEMNAFLTLHHTEDFVVIEGERRNQTTQIDVTLDA